MAKQQTYNWAHAFRDVVVVSINKGQLPLLGSIGLCALIIYKMTPPAVDKLAADLYKAVENRYLLGYVLWLLTIAIWWIQQKASRKRESLEMKRGSTEKTELQKQLSGTKYKSSEEL